MPAGITRGGLTVKLQGQDISYWVNEGSIDIEDSLAQGSGRSAGGTGRAKKGKLTVALGPAASAIGAGQLLPPTSTNMFSVNQSDIEAGITGFVYGLGSGTITQDMTQSWHGASSLKCVSSGSYNYQFVTASVPASGFTVGQQYTFSVYMKSVLGSQTLRFYVQADQNLPSNTAVGSTTTVTLTPTWTRYSVTVTIPTNTWATIGLRVDTGVSTAMQTWYMDGLQCEQHSTATTWKLGGTSGIPTLVRQGELIIYDNTTAKVFGGFATILKDVTDRTNNFTEIEFHDYWQDLDRTMVNEVYDSQTDVFAIRDLITKYAPTVSLSYIPTTGYYNIGVKTYRNKTLKQALQNIADITGYAIWIDANKALHYVQPTQAAAAPFSLSDRPDFVSSFQCQVLDYTVDDSSAINRVTFYGGKRLSTDFTQDMSNQATGVNKTFLLAYYPHTSSDGKYHVKVNGVAQVLGFDGASGAKNLLKSQGGLCDVLIAPDSHVLTFDIAPASGASVTMLYRHEAPLIVQVSDNNSINFYGRVLEATLVDTSVFDLTIAAQRCRILLLEQSMGLNHLQIKCYKAGLQAGQLLTVNHSVRGINNAFLIQQIRTKPLGAGQFEYTVDCGAWNWNLVDLVMKSALASTPDDTTTTDSTSIAQVQTTADRAVATFAATKTIRTQGQYYARSAAVGDGHDAYAGLSSI